MVITDDHLEPLVARELLSSAREGDAQAFCFLVKPLHGRLLRQAAALSCDLHAAEDLVSETLVEAWKSLPRYRGTCRLSTWLYAILLHRYQKSIRRARSRPLSLAKMPLVQAQEIQEQQEKLHSSELSPAEAARQSETNAQLKRCIELLPKKHREIILLRFFEDASLPD